jgi:phasin family protein
MLEAGQALMQRQAEIMQSAVHEATKATQDIMADSDPQTNAGKRFDTARIAFEKNVGNMSEMAEMSSKATAEAMEIIRARALAAFDEIRTAMEKVAKAAPPQSGRGSGRGARA